MDDRTSIKQIKDLIVETCDARNWKPSSKNIAISISLEASELLEHFQFRDDIKDKEEFELEVADVVFYLCELCEREGVDISTALKKKIKRIEEKYPADKLKELGESFYYNQKKKFRVQKSV